MRTAIEVVWWIGLIGALAPTLVIVKEAFLVVGALRHILHLAESTRVAAQGIAVHMYPAAQLRGVGDLVQRLDADVAEAAKVLAALAPRLDGQGRAG